MTGAHRLAAGCAAALAFATTVAACSDISAPLRNEVYEWRLFVPAASGDGADTLSFHWDRSFLPVRVWVENTAGLPGHMDRAITTWESVYLYREFTAEIVSDSSDADVIVRGTDAPAPQTSRTRLRSAMAPQCRGATDLDVTPDNRDLLLPIRVFVAPSAVPGTPGLEDCLALTSIHELGHALGIFQHSPNPTDIMFADPSVLLPSPLDRGTAEVLYHVAPTLEAVRR
ncbi:MAG: hypothetical protein H0T44_14325 [Gemmatimonadales bacterium]|nr:hypothetical protein [Gemmatimonadales bacterium]